MDFRNIPIVTKNLLIINVLIYFVSALLPGLNVSVERYCGLHYFISPDFYAWQPLTYMFLHGGFMHLFFNMFGVLMFGSIIERVFGSARYLLFYITVGIGAALVQEGVYALMLSDLAKGLPDDLTVSYIAEEGAKIIHQGMNWTDATIGEMNQLINVPTVGASGALFGLLLAFAMLFPNMPLYIMFIPIPIKAKWMVLGYAVLELFYGVTGLQNGVAHFAHLGGLIVALFLIIYWRKRGEINNGPIY